MVEATITSLPVGVSTMPLAKPIPVAAVLKFGVPDEKSTNVTQPRGRGVKVSILFRGLLRRGMKRWSLVT